jgi:hypothetical protein
LGGFRLDVRLSKLLGSGTTQMFKLVFYTVPAEVIHSRQVAVLKTAW